MCDIGALSLYSLFGPKLEFPVRKTKGVDSDGGLRIRSTLEVGKGRHIVAD